MYYFLTNPFWKLKSTEHAIFVAFLYIVFHTTNTITLLMLLPLATSYSTAQIKRVVTSTEVSSKKKCVYDSEAKLCLKNIFVPIPASDDQFYARYFKNRITNFGDLILPHFMNFNQRHRWGKKIVRTKCSLYQCGQSCYLFSPSWLVKSAKQKLGERIFYFFGWQIVAQNKHTWWIKPCFKCLC